MHSKPVLAAVAATFLGTLVAQEPPVSPASDPSPSAALTTRFVPNRGQWHSPERYRFEAGGLRMFLENQGWSFWITQRQNDGVPPGARPHRGPDWSPTGTTRTALRMTFEGANAPSLAPELPLGGTANFLAGATTDRHRRDVPGYGRVRYAGMYDGIDVLARAADGHFEYDLLLEPGADLDAVSIRVDGAERISIDQDGALVLATPLGDVEQPAPRTWSVTTDGRRVPVACRYVLRDAHTFGFVTADRDPRHTLVVDPPIVYGSYLGGSTYDEPWETIEDGQGRIVICGYTESTDFPTTPGVVQATAGGGVSDGYVAVIDPSQPPASQLVFVTYFGGAMNDFCRAVRPLASGDIAFSGQTQSSGLPTTPGAVQPTFAGGGWDGFLGVLSADGSRLQSLTYMGGPEGPEYINSIQVDPNGDLLFTGVTRSASYPTTPNALQPTHGGGAAVFQDIVLGRIDVTMQALSWSSFLGGTGDEWAYCREVSPTGVMTLCGATSSQDFPTTATAFQPAYAGGFASFWWCAEAIVAQVDPLQPPAQQLRYSTYFGGIWQENAYAARLASDGDIVISGTAQSRDLPVTAGAYQPNHAGGQFVNQNYLAGDGYLARIDPNVAGSAAMVYCTYLGGPGQDQGLDMVLDTGDEPSMVGWTQITSNAFPTTPGALRRTYGFNDGYLSRLSADGGRLTSSTLLGGITAADGAWWLAAHAAGIVTAGCATSASDFPTTASFQPNYAGGTSDAAVARVKVVPTNTTRYGLPTDGPGSRPTIHALDDATPGNAAFGFACSNVAPGALGVLLLGAAPSPATPFLGVDLYVSQAGLIISAGVPAADPSGESVTPLPLPTTPIGTLYAQYVWVDDPAAIALSASDALRIN